VTKESVCDICGVGSVGNHDTALHLAPEIRMISQAMWLSIFLSHTCEDVVRALNSYNSCVSRGSVMGVVKPMKNKDE